MCFSISHPFLSEIRVRFSFLHFWAGLRYWSSLGFRDVSPAGAPLAADGTGAFSGAVVLWCRVDGYTKGTRDGVACCGKRGELRDFYKLKDDERGIKRKGLQIQTAWLGSHYNGFLVRRFLQCGSLGCLVQVNHQHLGSAQTNEVWKRILGNRLGCIQFGHSSQHAVNKYRTCFTCSNLSISFKQCVEQDVFCGIVRTIIMKLYILTIGSCEVWIRRIFEEYILFVASWKSQSCSPIEGETAVDYHIMIHVVAPIPWGWVQWIHVCQKSIGKQHKVEPAIGTSRAIGSCLYHLERFRR